ncbi:protein of unknown function [Lactiplantibacillus plantarum]
MLAFADTELSIVTAAIISTLPSNQLTIFFMKPLLVKIAPLLQFLYKHYNTIYLGGMDNNFD